MICCFQTAGVQLLAKIMVRKSTSKGGHLQQQSCLPASYLILVINKAIGHRVAHGGEYFRQPEIITDSATVLPSIIIPLIAKIDNQKKETYDSKETDEGSNRSLV